MNPHAGRRARLRQIRSIAERRRETARAIKAIAAHAERLQSEGVELRAALEAAIAAHAPGGWLVPCAPVAPASEPQDLDASNLAGPPGTTLERLR